MFTLCASPDPAAIPSRFRTPLWSRSNASRSHKPPRVGLRVRATAVLLLLAAVFAAVFAAPGFAAQHPSLGTFGSASQPTFESARAIVVDQTTGDVLLVDSSAGTVSRFHADGTAADFSALGSNVISGAGPAQETPFSFGTAFEEEVAVDSSGGVANGDIYVAQPEKHVVDVFAETGEYLGQLTEGGGHEFSEPCGVTVDGAGHVFVGNFAGQIYRYEPTLNPVANADNTATFETVSSPCTLSAGAGPSAGSLFVSTWRGPITKVNSETGEVDYGIVGGEQNPTSSVDPATGHLFVASETAIKEFDVSGTSGPTLITTINESGKVEGVGVDGASGHVYVTPSASAEGRSGATALLEYGPLTPVPPVIEGQAILGVLPTEASLKAQVNPEGELTTVKVEYGLDSSYDKATAPVSIGAGEASRPVGVFLQGLTPGSVYHFRFSATNAIGTTVGSDETFQAPMPAGGESACPNAALRTGPAARLADCRAYEMVTPVEKNNTDIRGLPNVSDDLAELNQSALSGEALTYTTSQGFGDSEGVPWVSQYMARRAVSGWVNQSLTPAQGTAIQAAGKRLDLEYQVFSPDLCVSLLNHYTDPPLAAGAVEGVSNAYRRTSCGEPQYETVSVERSKLSEAVDIQGLSADGRCALWAWVAFQETGIQLHETCGGQTKTVSVLPAGTEPNEASAGTGPEVLSQEFSLRMGNYQNAISADGSRVYWTAGEEAGPLYVRENAQAEPSTLGSGGECLQPANACTIPVSGESTRARFWGASPDGSRAIYSVEPPSPGTPKLYEFDIATGESTLLASELVGVMGVDEQANRIYFVSEEALEGQGVSHELNLYLIDTTKTGPGRYKFVATVSPEDAKVGFGEIKRLGMLQIQPSHRLARVSADGLHAVFSSYAPLTGYDNRDAVNGQRDLEVFMYDALGNGGAGLLRCVSCNPTGQRPHGFDVEFEGGALHGGQNNWAAGLVPPFQTSFHGSRVLSEDGSRVFFDSYDALVPADTNGKEDVYEWEAAGSGPGGDPCTESSASFSTASGGCVSLISSGESASDSEFVDASFDGRDVFFKTAASLVSQDQGLIDIYDAREYGGFAPTPSQPKACEGTACESAAPAPGSVTPGSSTYSGPGDLAPLRASIVKPKPRLLTRAQQLAKGLKACKKLKKKPKRTGCEKQARKKYGARKAAKRSAARRVGTEGRTGR
jgi:hypothetical protein